MCACTHVCIPPVYICIFCCLAAVSSSLETPLAVVRHAALSMGFPSQEFYRGLPFPSPGFLPDPGIEPTSDALASRFLPLNHQGKPHTYICVYYLILKTSLISVQFSSVTQSCLTLCDPMDCSTPGIPVHYQLSEFSQTHVHWVGDAIQPSHPLLSPSFPASDLSQHQGLFKWVSSSHQVAKMLEFQFQHQSFQWIFRTGWISFRPRDSQESFLTPLFQSINSLALSFLYSPTLASIHDYLILVDAIIIPFCKEESRGSKSLKNSSSITKWWGWCWNRTIWL